MSRFVVMWALLVAMLLLDVVLVLGRPPSGTHIAIPAEVMFALPPGKFSEILDASLSNDFKVPLVKTPPSFIVADRDNNGRVSFTEYGQATLPAINKPFLMKDFQTLTANLRTAFSIFDFDGDQGLDSREYSALAALEAAQPQEQEEVAENMTSVQDLFRKSDTNGDGVLTSKEYSTIMPPQNKSAFSGLLSGVTDLAFLIVDANRDGVVTWPEFRKTTKIDAYGQVSVEGSTATDDQQVLKERNENMFKKLDTNRDNSISAAEFQASTGLAMTMTEGASRDGLSGGLEGFLKSLLNGAFINMDKNGDGRVSREEYMLKDVSEIGNDYAQSSVPSSFGARNFIPPPNLVTAVAPIQEPQTSHILESFDEADLNNDKRVSIAEYINWRRREWQLTVSEPKRRVLRMLFEAFDGNNRDGLDPTEFLAFTKLEEMALNVNEQSDEPFAFTLFDKDGNRVLNLSEYRALMTVFKRNGKGEHIPQCVIDYIFNEIDKNADNAISAMEFQAKPTIEIS